MSKKTRFRAYQLGTAGSSFSYSVDNHFTLIEARFNDTNRPNIIEEMQTIGRERIDCLHITSWDQDHCNYNELKEILKDLKPSCIEYPGYSPDTDNGKDSLIAINTYCRNQNIIKKEFSPEYRSNLENAEEKRYNNILYNPYELCDNHNDNSTVMLFRQGRFTVLSLGDCENSAIADTIMSCTIARTEVDIMILAHHGADNGFTTKKFISTINPKIAICSSNFENQYAHPDDNVRGILYEQGVVLYTTKTGDIIIKCDEENNVIAYNYIANGDKISSKIEFSPKLIINPSI